MCPNLLVRSFAVMKGGKQSYIYGHIVNIGGCYNSNNNNNKSGILGHVYRPGRYQHYLKKELWCYETNEEGLNQLADIYKHFIDKSRMCICSKVITFSKFWHVLRGRDEGCSLNLLATVLSLPIYAPVSYAIVAEN